MKFYRYKQLQRMTFFGSDDLNITDTTSLSKTSKQTRTANIPAVSSIVMYNLGVGPCFAYVSASARPQNNKLLWGPSKFAKT